MGEQESKRAKKHICAGLLAHVDAGKTTLSEALLYESGSIRRLGRVDKKDAFLDTDGQERERGITIFSKQAVFELPDCRVTLLDTPGHVDFSAEMERTLQVLDYAVLVISGSDGVQGHTLTLWRLLERYGIPVFVFLNKMDQPGTEPSNLLKQLRERLGEGFVNFSQQEDEAFYESIAVSDEEALNEYLETGRITAEQIRRLTGERKLFPCFFGSALKLKGIRELLQGISLYTRAKEYPQEFGARVFKITRDIQGNRLTHMKITGGSLRAKALLKGAGRGTLQNSADGEWEEKADQIRIYSGEKFELCKEAKAGDICAVTGLEHTWAGEGLGTEREFMLPVLEPVLSCKMELPEGCDAVVMLRKLRQLEEEEPQLHISWDENSQSMKVQIMGPVQIQVLQRLIHERFGVLVGFGAGTILYKETIGSPVEGVGHFEPLRHYAEVHLLMLPGESGSGLEFSAEIGGDMLDRSWQRLILTHLEEKEHRGVLTGAPITDMKIILKAGRAHPKHTEGGDFRQATYRAVRQGLMQADCILLEPWYAFCLEVPQTAVGRAMADLDKMHGVFDLKTGENGISILTGMAPMAQLQNYQQEVAAYTKGMGQLACSVKGYYPCHNCEEVMESTGYDPLRDMENPSDSVFCAHGAGFRVPWDKVRDYMHLESCLPTERMNTGNDKDVANGSGPGTGSRKADENDTNKYFLAQDEIEAILRKTAFANQKESGQGNRDGWKRADTKNDTKVIKETVYKGYHPQKHKKEYLLVDGYNVIFAWKELKELAEINLDGARGRLLDILCNYQAVRGCRLIAVFDAYRLAGHAAEALDYHNIHVVYTKEAETADQYIERFAHENSRKYDVTVATSDGLEQMIILGEGCRLISSRELKREIQEAGGRILEEYRQNQPSQRNILQTAVSGQALQEMEKLMGTPKTDPKTGRSQ